MHLYVRRLFTQYKLISRGASGIMMPRREPPGGSVPLPKFLNSAVLGIQRISPNAFLVPGPDLRQ